MKIRRLKAGDRFRSPEGIVIAVKPDEVGADRPLLLPEGAPMPIRLRRVEGRWKVERPPGHQPAQGSRRGDAEAWETVRDRIQI